MVDLRRTLSLSILLSLASVACEPDAAERWFDAMLARCRDPSDRASARAHCVAATNVALRVLRDAERAAAVLRYRCDAFGAVDADGCPGAPPSASADEHAAR